MYTHSLVMFYLSVCLPVCVTVCLRRPAEGGPVTSMELVVRAAKESLDDFYDMQFLQVALRLDLSTITACDSHSSSHKLLLYQCAAQHNGCQALSAHTAV